MGQIRSLLDGRAVRVTTLQSMTEVLGVRLMIGPGTDDPGAKPPYPEAAPAPVRTLERRSAPTPRPEDYGGAIATPLRDGVAIVRELADRVATAAQSLLQIVAGWEPAPSAVATGTTEFPSEGRLVMIPFASVIGIGAAHPEPVIRESPELTVGVVPAALPSWALPDRLVCMRAADDAMAITVRDGDLVAFDPGRTSPVDQALFALATDSGPAVRRLSHRERWIVVADNPGHADRPLSADDRILGQVAWHWPRDRDAVGDSGRFSRARDPGSAGA